MRRAAQLVRELEGQVANRPKHGEPTAVKAALTLADTLAQEAILAAVLEHFPEVSLRAEEDTPLVHRFPARAPATVVLDPIDGTLRSYLQGDGPYGVMVGLAIEGRYEAALVALPREGIELCATRGGGAFIRSAADPERRPAVLEPDAKRVFVPHRLPEAAAAVLRTHGFEPAPACGGAISVAPLLPGVRAGLRIAANEAGSISIRGRIGALIAQEAGATLVCETGDPFPRQIEAPARVLIVAGDRGDLDVLLAAVAAAGP